MGAIKFSGRTGKPIVSERRGWAVPRWDPETTVRVWRALVCLRCAGCGEWILPGATFVRRTRDGASGRALHQAVPYCRACYPFDEL